MITRRNLLGIVGAAVAAARTRCHAVDGGQIGQVTDIAEIGTDPDRLRSFTPELAVKMNTIGQGRPWAFRHFRKTNGYTNMPLDGNSHAGHLYGATLSATQRTDLLEYLKTL